MDRYITINIQSFTTHPRRIAVYNLLRKHNAVGLLQETYTNSEDEKTIKSEWGEEVIASHGKGKSSGVLILLPSSIAYENVFKDDEGRVVGCYLPSANVTLINIYIAPFIVNRNHNLTSIKI